ncbi:acetylglutamate kinase [bacterium]|nr:acetylglutamate kinase [bacterium]
MEDLKKRAEVLIEALPYIRRFWGKKIVIKYGGSAMEDPSLRDEVLRDVLLLHYVGMKVVLVHGGGKEVSEWMKKFGKEPVFVDGQRVTDVESLEIAEMVLAGKTNKDLVARLWKLGGKAVGISGKDAGFIIAKRKEGLGEVGEIERVDPHILDVLMDDSYIPVISSIAMDEEGKGLNVNADTAAGHIAGAIKAEKLLILTDVRGVLERADDEGSLISVINFEDLDGIIERVGGGMKPKLLACKIALLKGVRSAHIIDGRLPHSLLMEIFTDRGLGTMIIKD